MQSTRSGYHAGTQVGREIEHLPDNTVCALAQLLGHIIPIAHDKVLTKDLEDLATL